MTYKGHIKNGTVILDEPVSLPEGTAVEVDLMPVDQPVTLAEVFKDLIGAGIDLPSDASSQKRHYLYGHPRSVDCRRRKSVYS